MSHKLSKETIEKLLGDNLGLVASGYIPDNLEYEVLNPLKIAEIKEDIEKITSNKLLPVSGPERESQWEAGWGQNLTSFSESKDLADLIPKYFQKYEFVRIKGEFVRPGTPLMELKMLRIIQAHLIEKHVLGENLENLIEIGCGTGHNLVHINSLFPEIKLTGLDWVSTSQACIESINRTQSLSQEIGSAKFDFFNPKFEGATDWKGTAVATFAALEQTGTKFSAFIEWLLKMSPSKVIHVEPERSLLNSDLLADQLSLNYMESRGYLSGLLDYLVDLENQGKIEIIEAKRSNMGSYILDGYSIIVWRPLV